MDPQHVHIVYPLGLVRRIIHKAEGHEELIRPQPTAGHIDEVAIPLDDGLPLRRRGVHFNASVIHVASFQVDHGTISPSVERASQLHNQAVGAYKQALLDPRTDPVVSLPVVVIDHDVQLLECLPGRAKGWAVFSPGLEEQVT